MMAYLKYLCFYLPLSALISAVQPQENNFNVSSVNSTAATPKSTVIKVVVDRRIIMVFLLGIPPFTISLHTLMIYILFFSNKRHKYTNIFYKLLLTMSLIAIYWGGYFFYMGMCQLLGYSLFGETVNIIIASIAQYLFYVCMNMNLLIAFNRFSAVILYTIHEKVFSSKMGLFYIFLVLLISAAENVHGFRYLMKYVSNFLAYAVTQASDFTFF